MRAGGTVMCFGTFDIIHPGHIFYFTQAKKHAKKLIVVVARDANSKKTKKYPPIHNQSERLKLVQSISIVDRAVLGDKSNPLKPIFKFKPELVALGYDHKIKVSGLEKKLTAKKINCRVVRIKPYKPHIHKTSKIKRALVSMI
jgi:FAD synthetase